MNDASLDINKQISDLSTETLSATEGTSILSKVFVDHTPQVAPVSLSKRSKPKARLLTSAECLKMLQEKEAKKKQQLEEKERRRKEREEKKKLREEEAKRKKEEKERKAQEKAEKAKQKTGQSKVSRKRNVSATSEVTNKKRKVSEVATAEQGSSSTGVEQSSSSSTGNETAAVNSSIDVNTCCMCFDTYENDVLEGNGAEWIDCACGRWLHLDCAEDCVEDCTGNIVIALIV